MLQYCENIVFWRKLYGQIYKKSRRGGGNRVESLKPFGGVCFEMHRGVDAKRQSLLRLGDFDLYKKFVDILSLFKRNILISPLEGEKKFLSELRELRNFREGYNLKYRCRNCNFDRRLYFIKNINYNSDMLHHDKNNKGRLGILAQREAGKISCNKLFQHKTELKRIEPLSRISNAHYHSQRTAPSPRWGEGIDFVIINNFSDTVFSRFTSHFSHKRAAFTLAEVLITLGIIGIVAALTLPSLIQNYTEKATVAKVKKNYAIISQAYQMALNEEGAVDTWGLESYGGAGDETNILIHLKKYLNLSKYCGVEPLGCWQTPTYSMDGTVLANLDHHRTVSKAVLSDGTVIATSIGVHSSPWDDTSIWATYTIDVNGAKKPNMHGKDVFSFYFTKSRVLPYGTQIAYPFDRYCAKNSSESIGCTAWVLYNENLDYLHCNNLSWSSKTRCK